MASAVAEQGKRMLGVNKRQARTAKDRRKNVWLAQQRDTRNQEINVVDEDGTLTTAGQYPITLVHGDERDEDMELKAAIANKESNIQRFLTDEDISYYKDKEAQAQYEREMQWVIKRTNWNDPAQIQQLKEMFPEVIDLMKGQLDDEFAIAKQFSKIRMLGAQDADDVLFEMYLADGTIKLPPSNFWKGGSTLGDANDYVPGVFAINPDPLPDADILPIATRYGLKSRAQGAPPTARMGQTLPTSWQSFNDPTYKEAFRKGGLSASAPTPGGVTTIGRMTRGLRQRRE
jgi:hypothetical protein